MDEKTQDTTLRWYAPEFEFHEKGAGWYWTSIGITLVLLIYALFTGNFLFAVFVVLAEVMLFIWAKEIPRTLEFVIDNNGVEIGTEKNVSFSELQNFAVLQRPEGSLSEILLKRKGKLGQFLRLHAHNEVLDDIRAALGKRLPLVEYEETLPEVLFRLIGF